MSKIALKSAFALAGSIGCSAAQAQTPIPPSPHDFLLTASQSDQYDILAAQVAEVQGQDPCVRAFAQNMIDSHTRLSAELHRAALASRFQPPSGVTSDQATLLSTLQSLRGAEFNKIHVKQQVLAHTQADAVNGSFADAGADANLPKAAQAALPAIEDHLKSAQQLRAEIGRS